MAVLQPGACGGCSLCGRKACRCCIPQREKGRPRKLPAVATGEFSLVSCGKMEGADCLHRKTESRRALMSGMSGRFLV